MAAKKKSRIKPVTDDDMHLHEVRCLLRTAYNAKEEARSCASEITNKKIKEEAEALVDDFDTGNFV